MGIKIDLKDINEEDIDYDVTLKDLSEGVSRGALRDVLQQIDNEWVGKCRKRYYDTRCGTAYIRNGKQGNGEIVILLRFPLCIEKLKEIRRTEHEKWLKEMKADHQ